MLIMNFWTTICLFSGINGLNTLIALAVNTKESNNNEKTSQRNNSKSKTNGDDFTPFKDPVFKQRYVLLVPGCGCNNRRIPPIVPPIPPVGPVGPGGGFPNTQATLPPVSPSPAGGQRVPNSRIQSRRARMRARNNKNGVQRLGGNNYLNMLLQSRQSRLQAMARMNFWRSPFLLNG